MEARLVKGSRFGTGAHTPTVHRVLECAVPREPHMLSTIVSSLVGLSRPHFYRSGSIVWHSLGTSGQVGTLSSHRSWQGLTNLVCVKMPWDSRPEAAKAAQRPASSTEMEPKTSTTCLS